MAKSIEYWRKCWESIEGQEWEKTAGLFKQYHKTGFTRFYTFQWSSHHVMDIERTLKPCYSKEAYAQIYQNSELILCMVKCTLGDKKLNPKGDVAKIIRVIEEKTGLCYESIETDPSLITNRRRASLGLSATSFTDENTPDEHFRQNRR